MSFLSSFCVKCLCPFLVHSFSWEDASLCSPIFSCVGCSNEGPAGQNTKDCSTSATSLMDFQGIKPRDLEFVMSFYPRRDAFLQPISPKRCRKPGYGIVLFKLYVNEYFHINSTPIVFLWIKDILRFMNRKKLCCFCKTNVTINILKYICAYSVKQI